MSCSSKTSYTISVFVNSSSVRIIRSIISKYWLISIFKDSSISVHKRVPIAFYFSWKVYYISLLLTVSKIFVFFQQLTIVFIFTRSQAYAIYSIASLTLILFLYNIKFIRIIYIKIKDGLIITFKFYLSCNLIVLLINLIAP